MNYLKSVLYYNVINLKQNNMNSLKYIGIHLFGLILIIMVILGIGAAESQMWGWAMILLFGPFGLGYVFNFNGMIHFVEVYDRAWNISLKNN